jgi:hypothetical protein
MPGLLLEGRSRFEESGETVLLAFKYCLGAPALRRAGLSDASAGLLRGLAEECLAIAIPRMHENPSRSWTVAQLAMRRCSPARRFMNGLAALWESPRWSICSPGAWRWPRFGCAEGKQASLKSRAARLQLRKHVQCRLRSSCRTAACPVRAGSVGGRGAAGGSRPPGRGETRYPHQRLMPFLIRSRISDEILRP